MSVGLHAAEEVKSDFRPVDQKRTHAFRGQKCDREVDGLGSGRGGCSAGQEFGQIQCAPIGTEQVPAAVDDECWIRFVLGEHVVEGAVYDGEIRRGKVSLAPNRGISRRQHQRRKIISRLGLALPDSTKLECRCVVRAATARSSCEKPRRPRQSLRSWPNALTWEVASCTARGWVDLMVRTIPPH